MTAFIKPARSIAQQIALLQSRGLLIPDVTKAQHALQYISYYRLRAYWLPFEQSAPNPNHLLVSGTTLDQVLSLYDFDRRLRLLLLDGIELIEVAARGSWAHRLALQHGPHGYLNAALYPNSNKFVANLNELQREVKRSKDLFILHYKTKYTAPPHPPVWMVAEIMSFGLLSKWQSALGPNADRKAIARKSGLGEPVYMSFIHHLATVRNICAHHNRMWNRQFAVTMTIPTRPAELSSSLTSASPAQVYNTLTVMAFVLDRVAPTSNWKRNIVELLSKHPTGDTAAMGCPTGWESRAVWQLPPQFASEPLWAWPHRALRRLWSRAFG